MLRFTFNGSLVTDIPLMTLAIRTDVEAEVSPEIAPAIGMKVPDNLKATHRSLFDGSLQGVARTDRVAFSFQGHPEASPGPHDMSPLFEAFTQAMLRRLQSQLRALRSGARKQAAEG